ncbi:MAG TPA: hypothetical protein VIQ51_15305, partial [Chryseosolibacter sp.]
KNPLDIKPFWQYLVLCLAFCDGMAQSASLQMGARAQGMGYASACLSDVWSLTNNIAGLAETKGPVAAFTYLAIPTLNYFDRRAAVFAIPAGPGVTGLSVFRFGDDLYSEQILSLGFANKFGLASLGIKINYIQYNGQGIGTNRAVTASFGGIAALTPQLSFGAHILNINQPVINELTEERVPTRLMTGMSLELSENLITAIEIEKDLGYPAILKAALEYQVFKKVTFRTGFNFQPQSGFFGLGFHARKFELDYALQIHPLLGLIHQATVAWQFNKQ